MKAKHGNYKCKFLKTLGHNSNSIIMIKKISKITSVLYTNQLVRQAD